MNAPLLAEYCNDIIALAVTIGALAAYHYYLRRLIKRDPQAVLSHLAAQARAAWVETMLENPDDGILAIQTLRNSTMAATFLASTAVLLMIGVLTLSGQSAELTATWHALNVAGTLRPEVWLFKLLCMLVTLFFAFYNFSNAIRIYNNVGYMINVRQMHEANTYSVNLIAGQLNRAGQFFSIGMRSYYYLVPLVCWLFGPLYMVAAAIALVTVLLPRVDKIAHTENNKVE